MNPAISRVLPASLLVLVFGTCSSMPNSHAYEGWQELRGQRLNPHGELVISLDFSTTGVHLASGSSDKTIRLMRAPDEDFRTGRVEFLHRIANLPRPVTYLTFVGGGKRIACNAGAGAVQLWNADDGSQVGQPIKADAEGPVAMSPDGKLLAVGETASGRSVDGNGRKNGEVHLVRVSDGGTVRTLSGHSRYVGGLAFSPDGKWLASAGGDGHSEHMVRLWSVSDGELLQQAPGVGDVSKLVFSPDGALLAGGYRSLAGGGGPIGIWRAAELQLLRQMNWDEVMDLAFSPDGKLLAICSTSDSLPAASLQLVRVPDGTRLQTLVDGAVAAESVAFHPGGDVLAAGMSEGSVRFFSPSAD